jgi:hypothetical protein
MRGKTGHFDWGLFGTCSGQPKRVQQQDSEMWFALKDKLTLI